MRRSRSLLTIHSNETDTPMEDEEALPDPWILFTDGSLCIDGSRAGLIITNLDGLEFTYALRFMFDATNNEAEYEALIAGLRIAEQMGINNLQANVDLRLMANQVNGIYIAKEPGMIKYLAKVKALASTFKKISIKQVPRGENKKADALSKIASTSFAHLSKQVHVEELKENSIDEKEVLAVVEEEGRTWMTPIHESFLGPWLRCVGPSQANYVLREIHERSCNMHAGPRFVFAKALRLGNPQQKLIPITSPWPFYQWGIDIAGPFLFGLPGEKISDNGKQFRDNPFKDWCKKLLEIGMLTLRTAEVDMIKNDETLEINLDLLEEKREQTAMQEAKSKAMMEKYYNDRVRNTSFKPGDLVYQSNEASHAKDEGELGPKWEGPYEVTEALGKGAYKLRDRSGNVLP
ncbi:reverse transcriptase domain-containing protein [Tanacetum coccineum]